MRNGQLSVYHDNTTKINGKKDDIYELK